MIKDIKYNKEKQKLSFVTDMSTDLANAIRRSVLEIPILAIEEVEIFKNDCALYDEIVAHRCGLIPVKMTKLKEMKFKLKEKGPKTIYSSDISPEINDMKIPITILDKDQEIEMNLTATLGKGIDHIKHSPGLVYYRHNIPLEIMDLVEVDENGKVSYDEEELKEVKEELSKEVKKLKEVKELLFNLESWGQIDVKEIFSKSIEVLDENLEELNKAIK